MPDGNNPMARIALARLGETLRGKWHLDRLLGIGGMANVYAATHRNGSRGAVKILHREISADQESRDRFLREGYVANKVGHHGVVAVLDDDTTEDGSVFLVMELLEGETLMARAASREGNRLTIPEVLSAADQLLDVLAAAHDKGIVHRDIKPENLFITRENRLKVLDFGIARIREPNDTGDRTKTGSVFGTPAFMPPEQALGESSQINALTDLWAAGATIFTLLSGRKVREAASPNKQLLAAMTKPAPPLESALRSVPPSLAAVVDRALAFDQVNRWPSAREMQRALRDAGEATTVFAPLPMQQALPTIPGLGTPAAPSPEVSPVLVPQGAGPSPRFGEPYPIAAPSTWDGPGALPQLTTSPVSHDPSATRAPVASRGLAMIAGAGVLALVLGGALAFALLRPKGPANEPAAAAASSETAVATSATAAPAEVPSAPSAIASAAPTDTPPAEAASAAKSASAPVPQGTQRPAAGAIKPKSGKAKKDPWDKF